MKKTTILAILTILLSGCSNIPSTSTQSDTLPSIFPDNIGVTVPINIAPVNFRIQDQADKYVTVLEANSMRVVIKGSKVCTSISKWHKLTKEGDITVTVYEKTSGKWNRCKPFKIFVSQDEIDQYISYRIIPYSFEYYQRLSINQRDLTSFKEKVIYANDMIMKDDSRQCINCHYYRDYKTEYTQFHARQYIGGTIFYKNGELSRLDMSTDSTLASAVYPSWHPTHNYIAYSTNRTYQAPHTLNTDRIEVYDELSDLILYDVDNNTISIIEDAPDKLECYPAWSHDGRTLYYTAADYPLLNKSEVITDHIKEVKYNLYCKPFDPNTRSWGKSKLVFDAATADSSITWPRVSPQGRYMLTSISTHGVFTIHHSAADLVLFDLEKGTHRYASELNSDFAESYHSWASTGKWVVICTRREDGVYTRLYLAHFNSDGTFSKPFALPQRNPDFNHKFLYAFNTPEFTIEPIRVSARQIASFIKHSKPTTVSFQTKKEQDR